MMRDRETEERQNKRGHADVFHRLAPPAESDNESSLSVAVTEVSTDDMSSQPKRVRKDSSEADEHQAQDDSPTSSSFCANRVESDAESEKEQPSSTNDDFQLNNNHSSNDLSGVASLEIAPTAASRTTSPIISKAQVGDSDNDLYHIRAYRMSSAHRLRLCIFLFPHMSEESRNRNDVCLRIGAALRYFAGGDPREIAQQYSCTVDNLHAYALEVVQAVHLCDALDMRYPEMHEQQQEIAAGFELIKSDIGIDNCAGALGSMLIWTKLSKSEMGEHNCSNNNNKNDYSKHPYFCKSKGKFGLNMQAICDHNGFFLDCSVDHPGSNSNSTAFQRSNICKRMSSTANFFAPGMALYSNEFYPNLPWIKKPRLDKEMNFYHTQMSSQITEAFSNLVQRWALLRQPLPKHFGLEKQGKLASALCKLQNFCLQDREPMVPLLPSDLLSGYERGAVVLDKFCVPRDLLGGGDHFADLFSSSSNSCTAEDEDDSYDQGEDDQTENNC